MENYYFVLSSAGLGTLIASILGFLLRHWFNGVSKKFEKLFGQLHGLDVKISDIQLHNAEHYATKQELLRVEEKLDRAFETKWNRRRR